MMKLSLLLLALGVAALATGCKDNRDDPATSSGSSGVVTEDGPTCSAGAGAARTRMMTEGGLEEETDENPPAGGPLKGSGENLPAKLPAPGEAEEPVPGTGKDIEFEVKTKETDQATREALDKILNKEPAIK